MRSRPRYRPNTHRSITRIPCPVLEGHARIVTPGSVLNAFFGWGVLSRTEVSVGKVALASGRDEGPATVAVPVRYRGEAHNILVHVLFDEDG